ncbi:MAG TPA: hypothetical protein VFS36_15460 [Chitinophagaceae bacterium]|nr:hypothetical protein [Chitinophagaceae bacterium]
MEKKYYVSKIREANGDHEVHESTCDWLPIPENRIFLGEFTSCREAVTAAKKYYTQVNGCYYCSNECHTS